MTENLEMPANTQNLLEEWYKRCSTVAVGHYKAAERYSKRHIWISGLAATLSAIVGTTIFATLQEQSDPSIKLLVGMLSVAAAVLATISASMGFQDKAEKHRVAASKYNSAGRELEQLRTQVSIELSLLTAVRARLDALAVDSPHLPRQVHNEISNYVDISKWGTPNFFERLCNRLFSHKN